MPAAVPTIRPDLVRPRISSVADWLAREGLLVVIVSVVLLEALVHFQMFDDSWYTLLGGRYVAQHGLPVRDTLGLWTHGRRWIDQQWLAQIATYGAFRMGGLRALALCSGVLVAAALAVAMAAARQRGASARAVAWIVALVLLPFHLVSANPRAQTLAFVLFALELSLLAGRGAERSRRIFLVFPLLVVWANVHGSVVLGAALVALRGALELTRSRGKSLRAVALLTLPWVCLFASPYGFQLSGYYRTILVGSGFSSIVTEWAPTTLSVATAPLFLLLGGAIWLIGRSPRSFTAYDRALMFVLAPVSLLAIRNMAWFALGALVVLPRALDDVLGAPRRASRFVPTFNKALGVAAVVVVAALAPTALARAQRSIDGQYRQAAADRVASVLRCDHRATVFADVTYADWLLWAAPELEGRVAFDVRFELLRREEMRAVVRLISRVDGWERVATRYDLFVLDTIDEASLQRLLKRRLGFRPVYSGSRVSVLERAQTARAVREPSCRFPR